MFHGSFTADQPKTGWSLLDAILGISIVFIIIAMTSLTAVDVIARYWFNAPLDGAYELTQLFLASLIFAALPLTTGAREHVEVELISALFGNSVNRCLLALGQLISGWVLIIIGWRVWVHANQLLNDGAVTNSLAIPYFAIGYFATLSAVISGLIAQLRAWQLANSIDTESNND